MRKFTRCSSSDRWLGRLGGVWVAAAMLVASATADAARPRAVLGNFSGPNSQEMRVAVGKALAKNIDLVTDLEPAPIIQGRVLRTLGGRWALRLAVRDPRGNVLADETYDLREQRLYRSMPDEMAAVVGRVDPEVAPEASSGAAFGEQLAVGAGLGLSSRAFALKRANPTGPVLPAYQGSSPVLRLDVGAHPGAWLDLRSTILRSIGVSLMYEVGPKIESTVKETGQKFSTGSDAWEVGGFYRFAFGGRGAAAYVLRPGVRMGARSFSIEGEAPPVPGVSYGYKSFGADADVPLPLLERKLGLVGDFRYLAIDALEGGVARFAKTATASGYSFAVGARYRLPYSLEGAVLYSQTTIGVSFSGDAADGRTAREGQDGVSGIVARLSLAY